MSQLHSQLSAACTAIGNRSVGRHGFVPARSLVAEFNAALVLRPLLVEGMFAELSGDSACDWGVLIDTDRYAVDYQDVQAEELGSPLPSRMRYTIAHELAHSLSFRPTEFGIQLDAKKHKNQSNHAFVEQIENHTDALSPLLLFPEATIDHILSLASDDPLSASDIATICRDYGVSRPVFCNRLRLLPLTDSRRQHPALQNFGIAIATRAQHGEFQLRNWPVFTNFDRNIIPTILLDVLRKRNLSIPNAIPDTSFVLNGGDSMSVDVQSTAGTPNLPSSKSVRLRISAEGVLHRSQSTAIVTIALA